MNDIADDAGRADHLKTFGRVLIMLATGQSALDCAEGEVAQFLKYRQGLQREFYATPEGPWRPELSWQLDIMAEFFKPLMGALMATSAKEGGGEVPSNQPGTHR